MIQVYGLGTLQEQIQEEKQEQIQESDPKISARNKSKMNPKTLVFRFFSK